MTFFLARKELCLESWLHKVDDAQVIASRGLADPRLLVAPVGQQPRWMLPALVSARLANEGNGAEPEVIERSLRGENLCEVSLVTGRAWQPQAISPGQYSLPDGAQDSGS